MACPKLIRLLRLPIGFRKYATKIKVEMDPTAAKSVKDTRGRHHLGQTQPRKVQKLPEDIQETIAKIVKEHNCTALIQGGMALVNSLHGRHVPLEENEKELLAKTEEFKLQQKLLEKQPHLDETQYAKLTEKGLSSVRMKKKVKENLWKPVTYSDQICFQYLLLRGPADYAVLNVVLSEIAIRDPEFEPRSLLDFGSGVGTVSWAVEGLWKTCKEFYNVDISTDMRELAGLVLKRGNPQTEISPSIFFKGFLPVSLKYTHDLVVSAYALLELPSRKQRLETLLTLWNKTDSYLVVVEDGTYAGYKLVIEARDFILEMAEKEEGVAGGTGAHVFAPCAHDRACPKFLTSRFPCNFEVTYMQHPTVQSSQAFRERYSYVILKKGSRQEMDTAWPRVVEAVKVRNNHCRARLCTPDGEHVEVILSKAKHKDGCYAAIKSSMWGDSFPVILTKYEDDQLSSKERYRLKMLERKTKRDTKETENAEGDGTVKEAMENVEERTMNEQMRNVEEQGNRREENRKGQSS